MNPYFRRKVITMNLKNSEFILIAISIDRIMS